MRRKIKRIVNFRRIISLTLVLVMMITYMPTTFATSVYAASGASDGQVEYEGETKYFEQVNGEPFDVTVSKTIKAVEGLENYFDITLETKTRKHPLSQETDVILVLDISNTMNTNGKINQAKAAVKVFIDEYAQNNNLDENRRVGIVTFNSNATLALGLTECNDINDANKIYTETVSNIVAPSGNLRFTNIEGGLQLANNILKTSNAMHKYIILLTDGFPTTYISGGKESNELITGYDTYMSEEYDQNWETEPGYFAYTLGKDVKICKYGTSYSNRAALRAESVAENIKSSGINIFSVGFDIGSQSVDEYIEAFNDKDHSVVDTTGMSKDQEFAIGRTAASYQAWLEDKIAGGILLDAMGDNAETFSHGTDLATLTQSFQTILSNIEIAPDFAMRKLYTLDPMSDKVEFISFLDKSGNVIYSNLTGEYEQGSENTASYYAEGDEIYWDLLKSGYTIEEGDNGVDWLAFKITYRVRLENENFESNEWENAFETNNRSGKTTDLNYEYIVKNQTVSDKVQYFVPKVEGYKGELKFKKVDQETGQELEGAKFELQHDGTNCIVCKGDAEIVPIEATSGKDGMVGFTEVPSGHSYKLVETNSPQGYKVESTTNVIVSYGETYIGEKSETKKLVDGKINNEEFIIENEKLDPLKLKLQVKKTLDGQTPQAGKFKFTMIGRDENGEVDITIANDENGLVTFNEMIYTKCGTYELTISEVVGTDESIIYDGTQYKIRIVVSEEKAAGTYKAEISVNDGPVRTYIGNEDVILVGDVATFNNTSRGVGEAQLQASKKIYGDDNEPIELKGGEFTFELKDSNNDVLLIATNDKDGKVTFENLTYNKAGTYIYTISEVIDTTNYDIYYDKSVYTATVEVTAPENLTNSASFETKVTYSEGEITLEGAPEFVNKERKEANLQLTGLKTLNGQNAGKDDFSFVIVKVDENGEEIEKPLETVKTDENGLIKFKTLVFKGMEFSAEEILNGKNYTYKIYEVKGDNKNIKYDNTHYEVKVNVKPSEISEDYQLKVLIKRVTAEGETVIDYEVGNNIVIGKEGKYDIYFTNTSTAELNLTAKKIMDGKVPENEKFTFVLKDEEGQILQTVKNNAEGNIIFDSIKYEAKDVGSYTYLICENTSEEEKNNNPTVVYDESIYSVEVEVTMDENGNLLVSKPVIKKNNASVNEILFENTTLKASVKVLKVGEEDNPLKGAEFAIYAKADEKFETPLQTKTTDANGEVKFENLEYGDYVVRELKAPTGYNLEGVEGPLSKEVSVRENGEVYEVKYSNTKIRGDIKVVKFGENNDRLKDAEFTIYAKSDENFKNPLETKATDEEGEVVFKNYEYGDYVVRETKAPTGYNLDGVEGPLSKEVSVTENLKVYELEYSNTKIRGSIKVLKVGEKNEPLEGAVFAIYDKEDKNFENPLNDKTTDANGEVKFENLEYGDYLIREIKAPEGYNLDGVENPLIKEVSVTENLRVYQVKYSNTKIKGSIKVLKVGEDNYPLEGAEFAIYAKSDEKFENPLERKTTNKNGEVVFEDYEYGDYVVRETKAPEGYNLEVVGDETSRDREISIRENLKVYELEYSNTKIRGSIKVLKVGEKNDPLEGAEFTIYRKSDIKFINPIETKATDVNGEVVFENYEYGDYVVRETKAPEGYNLEIVGDETSKDREVSITENLKVYELEYSNTKIRASVKVLKVGEEDDPLKGAEFAIYDKSDKEFKNPLGSKTTDESGQVVFENLEYGDYVVREIKAPEGYNLEGVDGPLSRIVSITENLKVYEVKYSNTKIRGNIKITKFGENTDPLEGVEFTLYEKADSKFETPILVAITDENGIAKFENVQYGEYVIKETKAKVGYNNSDKTVEVNVLENEKLYEATFENTKIRGTIEVIKRDDKGELLPDTEFTLYSYDDYKFENPLQPPELTDENGRVIFENIEYGRYIVKETKAAEGYLIPEVDTKVIIAREDGVNYISEFVDEIMKGDIVITKVSEDGRLLSDVEFTLYCHEDTNFENPLKVVTTGDDGLAVFKNVEYGKYKVKETRTKEGYNLSTEVLEVNVDEHGKIYDFEVINTKIVGEILGTKISNVTKLPLEGAEFALYSINDTNFKYPLDFAISDESGKISFKNVEYGNYLLKEIKAPEGYYLMEEAIEVNITEHGDIYELEIENEKIKASIVLSESVLKDKEEDKKLPQTGDAITTGMKLAIAASVTVVGAILLNKERED